MNGIECSKDVCAPEPNPVKDIIVSSDKLVEMYQKIDEVHSQLKTVLHNLGYIV